jgi:hypothetical protein
MICSTCAQAGDQAAVLRRIQSDLTPEEKDQRIEDIRAKHRECEGGTWCDCQHRIVNVQGVPEARPTDESEAKAVVE